MAEKVGAARAVRAATVVRAEATEATEATEGRAAPLAGRVEWGATAAAWVVPERCEAAGSSAMPGREADRSNRCAFWASARPTGPPFMDVER